jgi:hypothetical protein
VAVALAAAVFCAAGCGGSSKNSTSTTTAASAAAATTSTTPTGTSAAASSSALAALSAALGALTAAGKCKSLAGLGPAVSQALSGKTADIQKDTQLLQQYAQKVPPTIKPDFETYVQDLSKIAAGLKPGTTPNPAALAKLVDMGQLSAASQHIAAWAAKNCHA